MHAVRITCAGPDPATRGTGQGTDDGAVYTQLICLTDAEQPIDGVHEVRVVEVILAPVERHCQRCEAMPRELA